MSKFGFLEKGVFASDVAARDPFYDLVPEKMWLKVTNIGVRADGMVRVVLEVNGQDKELYHGYVTGGIVSHDYNLTGWLKRDTSTQQIHASEK